MPPMPTLRTARLRLRPFVDADAPAVQRLASDRRVAASTLTIPHPYRPGTAAAWILTHEPTWEMQRGLILAVALAAGEPVMGAVGLKVTPEHASAELGYWIGVPYWGNGYATEAARAVIDFGFRHFGLNRIHAHHFARNVASGRVLEKAGLRVEGLQREAIRKWERFEDVRLMAILRREWETGAGGGGG